MVSTLQAPTPTTMAAPSAALLFVLSALIGCARPSTGLMVRIADTGPCGGQRDILLEVLPGGLVKLNAEDQNREELGRRLEDIFRTRVVRYVFVQGNPRVSAGAVAEVIDIARRHVDYVAVVTPSVMKGATYQGGDCLPHDERKDTCLNPRLPAGYITHTSQ